MKVVDVVTFKVSVNLTFLFLDVHIYWSDSVISDAQLCFYHNWNTAAGACSPVKIFPKLIEIVLDTFILQAYFFYNKKLVIFGVT